MKTISLADRSTTLFQSGDIRFLGETVYYTKNYTYTELCQRTYIYRVCICTYVDTTITTYATIHTEIYTRI
jgi:hypothetical protein